VFSTQLWLVLLLPWGRPNVTEEQSKPVIAIIDDDAMDMATTQRMLEALGWEVHVFDNDYGFSSRVAAVSPDIVLVDVNMPRLTGPAAVKALKQSIGLSDTKLVLFSGMTEEALRPLAIKIGADGFITKTSDREALARRLALIAK